MATKKPKPLAVFFADAHLDKYNWMDHPTLRGDSFHAFEYICEWSVEHKVGHIFGGGDLIDVQTPPSQVVHFVREMMDLLQKNLIEFGYVQGQHERAAPPWLEAAHPWPIWLHNDTAVIADEWEVRGLDWQPADRLADELEKLKGCPSHILLAHQVWEEFMGRYGTSEGSWSQVPAVQTLFTGDFHKIEHLTGQIGADGQELEIISPGSTNMREISEDPQKYFFVLCEGYEWRKIPIPHRMVIRSRIEEEIEFEELIDSNAKTMEIVRQHNEHYNLPETLCKPIRQLIFSDRIERFRSRAKKQLGTSAHLFFKVIEDEDDDDLDEPTREERKERQQLIDRGIEGCLELSVPKTHKHYTPLLRLITSKDKKAELEKMKEERFERAARSSSKKGPEPRRRKTRKRRR